MHACMLVCINHNDSVLHYLYRVKSESVYQKTVEASCDILKYYIEFIMSSIEKSVERCPKLLRLALRQLWLRVAEKFKDPEHVVILS